MSPTLQLFLRCDLFTSPIEKWGLSYSLSLDPGKFATMVETMLCDIWGYVIKDNAFSTCFSWGTCSWNLAIMLWGSPSSLLERSCIYVLADSPSWGPNQLLIPIIRQMGNLRWFQIPAVITPSLWHPPDATETKDESLAQVIAYNGYDYYRFVSKRNDCFCIKPPRLGWLII